MDAVKLFSPAFMFADMLKKKGGGNSNGLPSQPKPMPTIEPGGEAAKIETARRARERAQRGRQGSIYGTAYSA